MSVRLPQELIDEIVQNTDLVALVRASGVELKGRGKQLMGLCPFHDDKTPLLIKVTNSYYLIKLSTFILPLQ